MESKQYKLQVVRLLEPALCVTCRYASMATVKMTDGSSRRMMHCRRLDCDNWQTEANKEKPVRIYDDS